MQASIMKIYTMGIKMMFERLFNGIEIVDNMLSEKRSDY